METAREILIGVGTWAVTTLLGWIISKTPAVRGWIKDHPAGMTILAASLFAAAFSAASTVYAVGEIASLRSDVESLRIALQTWPSGAAATGEEGSISECPPGTYATRFVVKVDSGAGHDPAWSGHIECRPLNLGW